MADSLVQTRRFRVRARHEDASHGRILIEPTFEAAAIAYVEHGPAPADGHQAISVIVHDIESGHEHSFLIHPDAGDTATTP